MVVSKKSKAFVWKCFGFETRVLPYEVSPARLPVPEIMEDV